MARSIKVESKDFRRFNALGTTCDCLELILDSIGDKSEEDRGDSDLGDNFDFMEDQHSNFINTIFKKVVAMTNNVMATKMFPITIGSKLCGSAR